MTYKGHVERGAIVLDEPATLAEGTHVRIEVLLAAEAPGPKAARSLEERLAPFIGSIDGLPEDAAENHDHYLRGTLQIRLSKSGS